MSVRSEKNKPDASIRFLRLLICELKRLIRPAAISSAATLAVLAAALIYSAVTGGKSVFFTVNLYIAVLAVAVSLTAFVTKSTASDVCGRMLPRVSPYKAAAVKFTAAALASLFSAFILAACDLAMLLAPLNDRATDGNAGAFIPVGGYIAYFSLVLYIMTVLLTAAAGVDKAKTRLRRYIMMDGVLLYTAGLLILVAAVAAFSGVPLGSDAIDDLSGLNLASDVALTLSVFYLGVTALRLIYLFMLASHRLARTIKRK